MNLSKFIAILLFSLAFFNLNAQETNKEAETYYMDLIKYVENTYAHFEAYNTNLVAADFEKARKHLNDLSTSGDQYLTQLNSKNAFNEDSSLLNVVIEYVDCYAKGSKKELLRILNYYSNTYTTDEETKMMNEASSAFTVNSTNIVNQFNETATTFYQTHVQLSNDIIFCNGLHRMLKLAEEDEFESIKGEKEPNNLWGICYYTTELLPFMSEGTMISSIGASATFVFYRDSDATAALQYFDILEGFVDACDLGWTKTKKVMSYTEWGSFDGSEIQYANHELLFDAVHIKIKGTKTDDLFEVSINIWKM